MHKKIAILVGDGMADFPIDSLGGRTPLGYARTPAMDYLASRGVLGLARTVPAGMAPGSDTANLSIFGCDPRTYYTGRAPLEALNMGIPMTPRDVAFRCNLVNIGTDGIMRDFSADHVESAYSALVLGEVGKEIGGADIQFFPGVSYRNIMLWRNYPFRDIASTTPPHDIHGKRIDAHLPRGEGADTLNEIMNKARNIIARSAPIRDARATLKGDPTDIWLWGAGRSPSMPTLRERYGLEGRTISAVDLIHGIGRALGLEPMRVQGATGYLDTNYQGKVDALFETLGSHNFVFLHIEAPDESGHEGNLEHKLKAIEDFDARVVAPVMEGLARFPDYALLVMPDHPTPVSLRTHTADPVPFCICGRDGFAGGAYGSPAATAFSEERAAATGIFIEEGHRLLEVMLHGRI
ncbi:MAG: cofactor-independent phosphoglycerate mutase [Spirochaetes bacterium]|nr:MAG: cofactor-independent phosphoglycerate mutase [Spirochaetota bacterium]